MKRVFITGGLGFIGSNFIINQIKKNHQIQNFDKITYAANPNNLSNINNHSLYNFIKGDISDKDSLYKSINDFEPNYIVNFAAESHVDRSIDGPKEFINTNILGTYELLQASLMYYKNLSADKKRSFKFLHISTDEVYGSLGRQGYFNENSPYKPSSPYSASKAASDHIVKAWYHTYDLPTIITNCSNNYGPFQFPEKLIPLMILNILKNKPLPIYGTGSNIRDWLYVEDHCEALSIILKNGNVGETYCIGGNEEKTNLEIVNIICDSLDKKQPSKELSSYKDLITFVKDRPGHDFRYAIDNSKIKKELDWTPKKNFNEAIDLTIDWYLNNQNWWSNILKNKYQLERLGDN
ncbi:MAG: dTDP-glucose 4,6-dehydratase [Candidatus Marinimicrobia bacterium]|nr:dTDP-glucose 4,6-dehydratase [Candidatus Neomarinimicrobiota bacterium]|tara:strand:- start:6289 stop:7341 length:1053 start_codon:yes stop_codon:yes gene_type:complete